MTTGCNGMDQLRTLPRRAGPAARDGATSRRPVSRTVSVKTMLARRVLGGPGLAGPAVAAAALVLGACQPRVAVEAPKEPIVINLNVKIEHEVRVKVDRELETVFDENPELFGQ